MKIRKATKNDLKEIAEIFKTESSRKPYSQKWTPNTAFKKMKDSLKIRDVYVIELDKEIVGLSTSYIEKGNKEKAYIGEFWITKKHQGKGFGRELMAFLEKFYKKKGVKIIQLVASRNAGAYKFYKKLKYKNSEKAIFMEKKLK